MRELDLTEEMRLKRARSRRGRKRGLKLQSVALMVSVALAVMFAVVLFVKQPSNAQEARGDYKQRYQYDRIIEVDGVKYRERKRVTTILLLGIDRDTDQAEDADYFNGGLADFERLIVIDEGRKKVFQLQIDRDTITPITILGPLGDELGKAPRQICVAHSFGDGAETSRRYAVDAVSEFLLGSPVNFCIALRMDGISVLNDLVGGIEVTLDDDFSNIEPGWTKGATVTLMGDQAETFVRRRMDVSDGTNESRMRRQQQYIDKLAAKLMRRFSNNKNFIGTVYDALEDYMSTDISRGRLINEVWNAKNFERPDLLTLPGEHVVNEYNNMEFYVEEGAVQQLVLELFYEPLK